MNTFEDKLLGELKQVVAERAAEPAPPPRRRWGPRLALAGMTTAAVAAGLIIGVPILAGEDGPPAYAIEKHPDGTISVTLEEFFDQTEQLAADLRAAGIRTEARVLPSDKVCAGRSTEGFYMSSPEMGPNMMHFPLPAGDRDSDGVRMAVGLHGSSFTLFPEEITADETLVITHMTITTDKGQEILLSLETVEGPVPPCEIVDRPKETLK
jgi:hypothetical protein